MKKEEYILQTAKEMFLTIASSDYEWEEAESLEELAKTCAKCAEIIWKQVVPFGF